MKTHAAWAALMLATALVLVLSPQHGHPPPLALLPVVLVLWPLGHLVVWGLRALAARGIGESAVDAAAPAKWPAPVVIALLATGAGALLGAVQLAGSVLQRGWYPYAEPLVWSGMLLAWSVHGAGLAGLLLRRAWARPWCAVLAAGWAAVLGLQIVLSLLSPARVDVAQLVVAIGLVLLLAWFAGWLAVSREVRAFLRR
jgi:hypothetical protein